MGRTEYVVQCHGQFNDSQAGAKVTASSRHRIEEILTKLFRQTHQFVIVHLAQPIELVHYSVEKWCVGTDSGQLFNHAVDHTPTVWMRDGFH